MSSHVPVGEATAVGAWRKRKDRDSSSESGPRAESPATSPPGGAMPDNRLLAGCLAHEFLTGGTLFGKCWETSGLASASASASVAKAAAESAQPDVPKPVSSYAKVSYLLKADGARIPGVVNPTQLARWLQM